MKRLLLVVAFTLFGSAGVAWAQIDRDMPGSATHHPIGLGFHNVEAPVGIRWWLGGQKVGIDLGLGFNQSSADDFGWPDESLMGWAVDVGVPLVMHSWPRVHAIFRPGILWESQEIPLTTGPAPPPFDTRTATNFSISAEIEAEVFLMEAVSVSASHGIAYSSFDPDITGVDSQSSFGTFGNNFTNIGFHVYFLGTP
jgi:hypothetical protein